MLATSRRCIAVLFTLSTVSFGCQAATAEQTIENCWVDNAHPSMADCVSRQAVAAHARLADVEQRVRAALAASKESTQYIRTAGVALTKSAKSYAAYRRDQCTLRFDLASIGNAAFEVRRACEAELDTARADQLEASITR